MARARVALLAALVVPAGLVARAALANDLSYQPYPLGGRAVTLGGAFTALGSDPSGLFYNPAGLVHVRQGSVQVGTNLYGINVQGGIAEAFGAVVDVERVVSSLDIIPAAASGISVLERDADGLPITVYSLGSFVPASRNTQTSVINQLAPSERFPGCARLAYERNLSDRRFLFGGGVAHRLNERWSVGFSGFLAYRTLRDREEISCSEAIDAAGDAFSTADTRVNVDVFSLKLNFATKIRLDDGWRVGAMLTTPSIRAHGQAGVRVRQSRALPAPAGGGEAGPRDSRFLLREVENVRADTKDGLAIRVGAAKVWPRQATLSLDVALYAPTRYDLVELPPGDDEVLDAVTLTTDIERRAVVNVAFGGEYLFDPSFSLGGGLFTNLSSTPSIEGESGVGFPEDRLAHVNEVGLTLVGGFFSENNLTRIGLVMTYGEGADVVPRYAGLAAVGGRNQYVKTDVRQASIFLFVSNTTRY